VRQVIFGILLIIFVFSNLSAQNAWNQRLGLGVFGTRQSLVNYLDYGISLNQYRAELGLGYELGRALQYKHFAPAFLLGLAYQFVENDKIKMDFKTRFLRQYKQYPSNSSLVSNSLYVGYELRVGNKIQFSQALMLGFLNNEALSGYNKLTHDFLISVGVHYVFYQK
jgi:hypothetical protein